LEPVSVYLFKRYAADGSYTQPNKNIQPGTAIHYVASYEQKVNEKTKIKVEAYIQDLSKVPIDSAFNGTYSLLNTSGGIPTSVLQNVGFGKNKGIELTIEKFYSKNFYYLITASLFDSKYQNKNMVWHNTIYNNKYAGNILIGKEFKLKKNNAISVNVRYMLRGGNRYTPIILSESIKKAIAVLDYTQFYEAQYPDYWRTDLSVSYKKNKNKSTWSYGADIQNVTDRKNLINQTYDVANKRINDSYALPRIPILFIRCEF
jgi:outer membrane receptor protein involved in Fe transport